LMIAIPFATSSTTEPPVGVPRYLGNVLFPTHRQM
jgi:hypothetical protein